MVTQLVEKFPIFYGTQGFTAMFKRTQHWSLSWGTLIQFTTYHPVILISTLLFSHLRFGYPGGIFPSGLTDQNFVCMSHCSHACYMCRPSHPPWFDHPNIWWCVQITKLLTEQCSPASCNFLPLTSKHSPQHTLSIYVLSLVCDKILDKI